MPPLTVKKLPKIGKKSGKIGGKEEKSGRKDKNREGSFTLPLLTDRAGYATDFKDNPQLTVHNIWYITQGCKFCRKFPNFEIF